ncbi:MAG TPA: LysR family transcriptional regulator [Streptosporangiaceae bacterium]|jgi:DNA-binding transcriptional LysR family regulator
MKRDQVDLNLLVALDALIIERNVTKAAARLRIGQPAMSASLARLRRVFGDPLLIRSGRTFTLTPLAQSLAGPLQGVLADVENVLTQRPGFDPRTDARTFTVVGSDYVTFILLRHFVPALYAQAPGVTIRISPLAAGFQQSLDRGDADVLILPAEFDRGLLRFPHSRLFTDDFVGVVWAGNTEVGDSLTAEEFSRVPQLANEPGQFAGLPETRLTQLGVQREIEVTARTFVMGPLLVHGTRLLTIVHRKVAAELAGPADCRLVEIPFDLGTITQTMFWHPRLDSDPAHRWLRERIRGLVAGI